MTVQRIRVLLVETDEADRKAVESYVRQEALPYDLYTASSAPEAVKRLQTGDFDVILLDYSLQSTAEPDLLSQAVTTPVIFVTGDRSGQITVKHMPQGAYDYLNKDPYGNYLTILPITIRNAIERQEAQHALQQAHERSEQRVAERTKEIKRRLQFEELTSGILAEFIQLPVNEVEKGIDKALKRIAQHSDTARSSLFIYSKDLSRITNTHEWCADPKDSQKERLQDIPSGTFGYYFSILKKLENVIISRMDDLPPEAVTEREWCAKYGFRPLLFVPLNSKGSLYGTLGFYGNIGEEKEWSSDFIALLRFVADIFVNVLERLQSEQERQKLEEQLLQARKMEAIGSLAGGIAHDFNNILGAIMGYAELIADDIPEGGTIKNNLQQVLIATNRAKEMVEQILAFSRKDEKERKPVLLNHILAEALKLLRASLPSTIDIRIDVAEKLSPVMANSTQIHQVIMNVCANASHAMREAGGILAISLKDIDLPPHIISRKNLKPGRYQQLSFSDTGCGIDSGVKQRIFDPYFTTKKQGEGTGMGLAVVHGIVRNHRGGISVYSEPGKGTTVHVFLPVTEKEDDSKAAGTEILLGGGEKILFVDDEPELVQMGEQMLEKLGYEVVGKSRSDEAWQTFHEAPGTFDLIITDQTMPHMTGVHLAGQVKNIRPDIPVILCTGFSESISKENFKSRGIDAFLMKPILKKQISRVIRQLLDGN